mgnify:CR=1 FL=1
MHYVYILKCRNNRYYTGITSNLQRRLEEHSKGLGARFTKYRLPVKLVYFEKCSDKIEAAKREKEKLIGSLLRAFSEKRE